MDALKALVKSRVRTRRVLLPVAHILADMGDVNTYYVSHCGKVSEEESDCQKKPKQKEPERFVHHFRSNGSGRWHHFNSMANMAVHILSESDDVVLKARTKTTVQEVVNLLKQEGHKSRFLSKLDSAVKGAK